MSAFAGRIIGLKTYFFFGDRGKCPVGNCEAGSVVKALLGLLAVGAVCAGGFYLYAKGKPLSENPLAQLTQTIRPAASDEKPEVQKSEFAPSPEEPGATPAAARVQDQPPSEPAESPAPVIAQSTPLPLRTAPTGMVFLAKRITVTRETGISSYPAGTLILVKSKAGGNIRGSINGAVVDVAENDTSTTFQP
jgi:hypothetical protein